MRICLRFRVGLMNDSIMIGGNDEKADFFEDLRLDEDENIVDFFKQQSSYPAINIGHLGTAIEYQGNGIGMAIIEFVAGTFSMYRQAAETTSFAIRKTGSLVQTAGNQNMTNPVYLGI